MAQSVENFIRKTGIVAGAFNFVLFPLFAWLTNRAMNDVPLAEVAVDTVITCIIMSLLVSLFISAETRRTITAGGLESAGQTPPPGCLLRRLPARPWKLGLILGGGAALVIMPWLVGLFSLFSVSSFAFFAFALLKAVYTPLAAYAVARWVILRQLAAESA